MRERSGDQGCQAKFVPRLLENEPCALQGKTSHNCSYNHVGPAGACPEHPQGSQQHGEIAQHVVARANPRRTHVRISAPVSPQEAERSRIGDKRRDAYRTHRGGVGSVPCHTCQAVMPSTHKPNTPMVAPLRKAAIAR